MKDNRLKLARVGRLTVRNPPPPNLKLLVTFFFFFFFFSSTLVPRRLLCREKFESCPKVDRFLSLSFPLLTRRRKSLKIPERAQHLKNRAFEGSIERSLCSRQLPFLPSFFLFRSKKRGSSTWKNRKIVEKKKGIRISKFPTFERNNNNNNNSFRFVSL